MKIILNYRTFSSLVWLIFIVIASQSSNAQGNLREEIDAKIKKLEQDKKDVESSLGVFKELKSKVESNEIFLVGSFGGILFLNKEQFNGWITARIMNNLMTVDDIEPYMKKIAENKKDFIKVFDEEIKGFEEAMVKIKDEISYNIDQKTKLNEPTNCVPYVTGTYIIDGDPMGIMILTQSGTHVEGTYGPNENSQINKLSGDFKCGELTGTYINNQYKITGKFVYNFSQDGKTYSGSWWNDTGGSNGSNSGKRK